jgi:hypothetical protein
VIPAWWLADTAAFDMTWPQEVTALLVGVGVVAVAWTRFRR